MENYKHINLVVASSPHIMEDITTTKIMSLVIAGLLPSLPFRFTSMEQGLCS
jgi:Na+-translocating ferredoxin:NAD+ oxidoreductase RnfD subunit